MPTAKIPLNTPLKGSFGFSTSWVQMKENEIPKRTSVIRQLVLEISRLKITNMDVAIFLISSLIFV